MKQRMKYLIPVLMLIFLGITTGLMTYYKPHKSLTAVEPDYVTNAGMLYEEFMIQEARANEKYLDKVLLVSGEIKKVTEVADNRINITLETGEDIFGVSCTFEKGNYSTSDFTVGELINIKGICAGMLMDVVLVNCVKVNS